MFSILANIPSLIKHLEIINTDPEYYRSKACPHCGMSGVWFHGHYDRKADRENSGAESLNLIPILRFFCNHCKKTHSVLPECIPPRRWYLWIIQQAVILGLCAGKSLRSVSQNVSPARSTCRRWWQQLQEAFVLHRDALSVSIYQLGSFDTVATFWNYCLQQMSLAKAMHLCHLSGIIIP